MNISHHVIAPKNGLDPINLFLLDMKPGQGRLVVTCYTEAWTCYWGAMGGTLVEFLRQVSPDYIASNLFWGRRQRCSNRRAEALEEKYLERIATEIIEYVKTIETATA
jgi:hypothetical protein